MGLNPIAGTKCINCNKYTAKIFYTKAGMFTELYYLRCINCKHEFEARAFQLKECTPS